jgi:hypothetical protein
MIAEEKNRLRKIEDLSPSELRGIFLSFEDLASRALVETAQLYGLSVPTVVHLAVEWILKEHWHAFSQSQREGNSTTDRTIG